MGLFGLGGKLKQSALAMREGGGNGEATRDEGCESLYMIGSVGGERSLWWTMSSESRGVEGSKGRRGGQLGEPFWFLSHRALRVLE